MKKFISIIVLSSAFVSFQSYAFDIFHPIKSAEKAIIVGAVGYFAFQGTVDYLIKHPYSGKLRRTCAQ